METRTEGAQQATGLWACPRGAAALTSQAAGKLVGGVFHSPSCTWNRTPKRRSERPPAASRQDPSGSTSPRGPRALPASPTAQALPKPPPGGPRLARRISANACVPSGGPDSRFFYLLLPTWPTLASREAPRRLRRAWLGSRLSQEARHCGFRSPHPCLARAQQLGELSARARRQPLWASVSPLLSGWRSDGHTAGGEGTGDGLVGGGSAVAACEGRGAEEPRFLLRSLSPRTFTHLHAQKRRGNAGAASLAILGMEPANARTPVFCKGHPQPVCLCACVPVGEDKPVLASRCTGVRGAGSCVPICSAGTAAAPGFGAFADPALVHGVVLTHLPLRFEKCPVRALELPMSPLALPSLSLGYLL
ncbi:uncharacterized protein LOC123386952 [Mustela putorius furo]|uniref:Uncharacterized protein LOC123386952 n=1 Tax=Mustela putorius furo TaxID=9669 RepID=A0A8U0RUP2_MUSPF|nr:uncharacterized protein LOC123386952 [Mustela putorius furo]